MLDKENILKVAHSAIHDDPTISDPTGIIPSVRREGPIFRKKTVIQLDGTVRHPIEVDKVAKMIRQKLPNVEIDNNLIPA